MKSAGVKEMTLMDAADAPPAGAALTTAQPSSLSVAHEVETFERLAKDPNMDVDKLERLVQMYERAKARSAEEQFNASMTAAQKIMRPIAADAENPSTRSKYATYGKLDRALRPIYTDHGFGVSYDTADSHLAEHVRVVAYVTHAGGHARTYHVDMPADGKGAKGNDVMTKTHAAGAAMSYGMRYLLKMIFNVAVGEDDRDGNTVQEIPAAPEGFAKWWDGMGDVVPEGLARYAELWKAAKPEYRKFVNDHLRDVHELRKKAAELKGKAVQS